MKAGARSWYTREDLKAVADPRALLQTLSYSRVVILACGHSARLTGQRAVTPPKHMYCFTCRCNRRDRENGLAPRAGALPVVRPGPTAVTR